MKRILSFLVLSLFFNVCFSQTKSFHVLYLNSYNAGYSWSDSISYGLRRAFFQTEVNLYTEHLDAKVFGQSKFETFHKYLAEKYDRTKFDLVVTSDNDALDFVQRYEDYFFHKIPVVFCGIVNPEDYQLEGSNKYGYIESVNPEKTIPALMGLFPKAKSLLFITDITTTGKIMVKKLDWIRKVYPYFTINVITDIDTTYLTKVLREGKQGDIVYITSINHDKYGNRLTPVFFQKVSEASVKPIFADNEFIIGNNIVGGNSNRGFTQGFSAGTMALKILRGDTINLSHINTVSDDFVFDYKLIKKFGIRKRNLPTNSTIINEPIIAYGRYIVILSIIVLTLSVIIVILTILNRKRLRAEKKVTEQLKIINERNSQLEESYTQVSDLNCELEEANAQLQSLNKSLEEAKDKAEESEKLKSSFLANLSHEIRTPLNAILGFSSLLAESKIPIESKKTYSDIIQSNSESLLVLIDDILDFSKIEAGQVKIQLEEVYVDQILKELFDLFKQKTNDNLKLIVTNNAEKDQVLLLTDKIRFKQILGNLLTNAFKFTEKGSIEIGYELINSSEIKFFVKDTGIGIDEKHHSTIFERFRKLDNDTKHYSGSGLGLAICKRLVELLGGRIWVEGALDSGSRFYFIHPDYTIAKQQKEDKNEPKPKNDYFWKGKLVAIAEDEENNFLLLERVLTKHGIKVQWFKDGELIVNHFTTLDHCHVDLILMDIKMPNMDGYQALERIRKFYPQIPVIAQTAYAMGEDITKIRKKGFNDFITKPINMDLLKEKLNKFLAD